MESASPPSLHPAFLPPGTQVGPWRVVDWAGRGVHGAVYRAVRVGAEHEPPVALKLALLPKDPRFAREVELLSRQHHPHIPSLIDHGEWQHPDGTRHPYIAMEWVDGVPLYDWAQQYHPDSAQVLRLLAQVALALQAVHAQEAVHRDIKGDNILVRRWDSRVFLTDFGSSTYPGADTLTPPTQQPSTPAYRAPEVWQRSAQHSRTAPAASRASPADDLYALGVTACRLVTGTYPELGEARRDAHGTWGVDSLELPPALFSARVEAPLRQLILRMLSLRPEQRGTAAQLARDLERATTALTVSRVPASVRPRADTHSWRAWLTTAAAVGTVATVGSVDGFGSAQGAPPRCIQKNRSSRTGRCGSRGARRCCGVRFHRGRTCALHPRGDGCGDTSRAGIRAGQARCEGALPSQAAGRPQRRLLAEDFMGAGAVRSVRRLQVPRRVLRAYLSARTAPHHLGPCDEAAPTPRRRGAA